MVRKCLKNKSKRVTCHKRYKIIKKVKEHHRKLLKEAKKNLNRHRKDPGVPNILPFKESFLKDVAEAKMKLEEARLKNIEYSQTYKSLKHEDVSHSTVQHDVKDVIIQSDVILEVLDARDPMGTRCPEIEETVLRENKRLVLLINKIDLVPRSNLEAWVNYLRKTHTVITFKANTQRQSNHLSCGKPYLLKDGKMPSKGFGTSELLSLLANYSRDPSSSLSNTNTRLSLTVGVVGLPNTGKSALINTLKRQKVCVSGNVPGLTRQSQRVRIDKNLFLLDTPGTLISKSSDASDLVLKNCIKPEMLPDPVPAVEAILRRCSQAQLVSKYKIEEYNNVSEFLVKLAHRLGRMKKGGIPDTTMAARSVINDWIIGKITYSTEPPYTDTVEENLDLSLKDNAMDISEFPTN
ncbi:Stress response protein nst1, variant 3 [Schistosoma haematobium]|uniref:Stress response protein nst1, variant 3 n=3 Tax=Schistosoma haematobium TaxID=6185 RepID=A0A6A5DD62_SCHHA|nr:Stress response protein nst1, variant 3 [Schistosoma haematobium]KAH9584516.1 Stress response protein nst1, variant 3 [Schistosoma haematobium]CAH8501517.1 unnamed protein product [Schistosoma haematobium]CAH8503833.1 unnamed protein product [Schistosoma haematobium]